MSKKQNISFPRQHKPGENRRNTKSFSSLGDIIDAGFKDLLPASLSRQAGLAKDWSRWVGPEISAQSRAVQVKSGILHVVVTSSVWLQEITLMKSSILLEIQKQSPEEGVLDIQFRLDGGK